MSSDTKELSAAQLQVLQSTYDWFREKGIWPRVRQLDHLLDREFDLDLAVLAPSIPPSLLQCDRTAGRMAPDQNVRLTLAGVARCERSEQDIALFLTILRYCVLRERTATLPPDGATEDIRVSREDIAGVLGVTTDNNHDLVLAKAYEFLLLTGEIWNTASGSGSDAWSFSLDRRIRRYRQVASLHDFLAAAKVAAAAPPVSAVRPSNYVPTPVADPDTAPHKSRWRVTRSSLIIGVVASLIAAAIWQGAGSLLSSNRSEPTTTSSSTAPAEPGTITTPTSVVGVGSALLALADVPSGWIPVPAADLSLFEDADHCDIPPRLGGLREEKRAAFAHGPGKFDERVDHSVARFEPGEAKRFLDGVAEAISRCRTTSETQRGVPVNATADRRDVQLIGQQVLAFTERATGFGLEANAEIVYVRWGNCVSLVAVQVFFLEPNRTLADELTRRAVAKLGPDLC